MSSAIDESGGAVTSKFDIVYGGGAKGPRADHEAVPDVQRGEERGQQADDRAREGCWRRRGQWPQREEKVRGAAGAGGSQRGVRWQGVPRCAR